MISQADLFKIHKLELTIGYAFEDILLLQQALTHRSFTGHHNERLEFLGDSILGMIVANELYNIFPNCPEGDLTRMRSSLVRETTLAQIAREFQIGECLRLGPGELKTGGASRDSLLADALESIIGAMFLDAKGNFLHVKQIVIKWFESRLKNINPKESQKDAKSLLQELLQAHKKQLPVYRIEKIIGNDNHQVFEVSVTINEIDKSFYGQGQSRRKAEQDAAAKALVFLKENIKKI